MDINKRYNILKPDTNRELGTSVSSYIPRPTESDYTKGYINRFFVQRVNDKSAPIYEVNTIEFNRLQSNFLFNSTSLRWKISGTREPQFNKDGIIMDKGIRESNRISIQLASSIMQNIKLYLPNLAQFSKNG